MSRKYSRQPTAKAMLQNDDISLCLLFARLFTIMYSSYKTFSQQEITLDKNDCYLCPGRKVANCRVHRSSDARFVMNCVT